MSRANYQDTWIRGEVSQPGTRECSDRYELVRQAVVDYTRPVTILDLGANRGYFGCRLAEEFGAVSVMVESRSGLADVCAANGIPTTIAIQCKLTVRDLQELAKSEHFDVVLALNVVHHFNDHAGALAAILALGERVVIETPSRDDVGACKHGSAGPILEALRTVPKTVLGEAPSHVTPGARRPMYLVTCPPKSSLAAGYCYGERMRAPRVRAHTIESSPAGKRITFAGSEPRDWLPGINLWNWAQLGGSYPRPEAIDAAVSTAVRGWEGEPHGDVRPWNLILQGDKVALIDGGHRHRHDGPAALAETLQWVRNPASAYKRR